jgi:hypothetical protein
LRSHHATVNGILIIGRFRLSGRCRIREGYMHPSHLDHNQESRLRIVFSDTVVSFGLAASATIEDIARTLGGLSSQRYGPPVAIDITLGPVSPVAHRRPTARRTDFAQA